MPAELQHSVRHVPLPSARKPPHVRFTLKQVSAWGEPTSREDEEHAKDWFLAEPANEAPCGLPTSSVAGVSQWERERLWGEIKDLTIGRDRLQRQLQAEKKSQKEMKAEILRLRSEACKAKLQCLALQQRLREKEVLTAHLQAQLESSGRTAGDGGGSDLALGTRLQMQRSLTGKKLSEQKGAPEVTHAHGLQSQPDLAGRTARPSIPDKPAAALQGKEGVVGASRGNLVGTKRGTKATKVATAAGVGTEPGQVLHEQVAMRRQEIETIQCMECRRATSLVLAAKASSAAIQSYCQSVADELAKQTRLLIGQSAAPVWSLASDGDFSLFESLVCRFLFQGFESARFQRRHRRQERRKSGAGEAAANCETGPRTSCSKNCEANCAVDREVREQAYASLEQMEPVQALAVMPELREYCIQRMRILKLDFAARLQLQDSSELDELFGGTARLRTFLVAAKATWALHLLAHSLCPPIEIYKLPPGESFDARICQEWVGSTLTMERERERERARGRGRERGRGRGLARSTATKEGGRGDVGPGGVGEVVSEAGRLGTGQVAYTVMPGLRMRGASQPMLKCQVYLASAEGAAA